VPIRLWREKKNPGGIPTNKASSSGKLNCPTSLKGAVWGLLGHPDQEKFCYNQINNEVQPSLRGLRTILIRGGKKRGGKVGSDFNQEREVLSRGNGGWLISSKRGHYSEENRREKILTRALCLGETEQSSNRRTMIVHRDETIN